MPHRLCLNFLLGVTLFVCLSLPVAAKDKWINLQTKNLNLISNAPEKDTRELATRLEQFRAVFGSNFGEQILPRFPTTVFVFKNEASFDGFRPGGAQAYYLRRGIEPIMAVCLLKEGMTQHVIHHEYTHALTDDIMYAWPFWMIEGVADLYSSFEIKENQAWIGIALERHLEWLRPLHLMPLSHLFTVETEVHEYGSLGFVYCQGWALTHYLMFRSEQSARDFGKFSSLLASGTDPIPAFEQAFGTDLKTVQKGLNRYVMQKKFPALAISFDQLDYEREATVKPLSEADASCYLGNLLVGLARTKDAERYFKNAAGGTESGRLSAGWGLHALYTTNFPAAKTHFQAAIAGGFDNYMTRYGYAQALLMEATGSWRKSDPIDVELAKQIASEAGKAIHSRPSFTPAYLVLGELCLALQGDYDEGVKIIKRAINLDRHSHDLRLALARLQASLGDYDNALRSLEPVLTYEHYSPWKGEAARLKKQLLADARKATKPTKPYLPPPPRPPEAGR